MGRRLSFFVILLSACFLVIFASGCLGGEEPEPEGPGEAELCEAACDALYNGCRLFLQGVSATERSCRRACQEEDVFRGEAACIAEAECGGSAEEMILECLPPGSQVEYCEHLGLWPVDDETREERVLELVNQRRAQGADCGSEGSFDPTRALVMDPILQCAARLHSVDMAERDFWGHTNPDGEGPFERIEAAGYTGGWPQGENIAAGYPTPEAVVDGWMKSDGHCSNIMEPGFTEIGVGVYQNYWTQKFGAR